MELQRQVGDLNSKGLVGESTSLFVISVLILPKKNDFWHMHDGRVVNNNTKNKFFITQLVRSTE